MYRIPFLLSLACAFLVSVGPSAWGHSTGKSNVLVELREDGSASIRMRLDEKDVIDLVDVDLSSERERENAQEVLTARFNQAFSRWLGLQGDDVRCPLRFERFDEPKLRKVDVYGRAKCTQLPQKMRLQWNLAKGKDLDLVAFITLRAPDIESHKVVLSKKRPQITVRVSHPSTWESFKRFFLLGGEHIVFGWDHLAFLLTLLLSCATLKRLFLLVTSFTVAHSITLSLAATDVFRLPLYLVEPAIALSISVAALVGAVLLRQGRNSVPGSSDEVKTGFKASVIMALLFGLLHGLGFAAMLQDALDDAGSILTPLFAFNAGVEVGQMCTVAFAFPILVVIGRKATSRNVFFVLYVILGAMGAFWFSERLLSL
ncbi:MAG: HupE/UreJ family protein [Deltaproteobacteria bacterium]|nr:HupE/UreJ family protein [Deltaproteobacteria bacterium]